MEGPIVYNEGVNMYTKYTWSSSSTISAEKMNHLETQYDAFMSILNAHNHNDRYYTKSEADARYYHSGHMGYGSGADADLLDGYQLNQILGNSLPIGAICIWKGSIGTIPSGWAVCNGSNGTPDLRDRFIMGSNLSEIGQTGGTAPITTAGGSVTTSDTTLSTNHIPRHAHYYNDYYAVGSSISAINVSSVSTWYSDTSRTTNTTGSGQGHNHGSFNVTFNSFSNIPPYYALYYIMKVS